MGIGDWFERRKQKKAKEEVLRIGNNAADTANAAMAKWEVTCLDTRRTMIAGHFDERITAYNEDIELPFDEWAEIESIALLKNWIEQKEKIVNEIFSFLQDGAWEILQTIGVHEEYWNLLQERFDEVGHLLAEDITIAIEEERARRGIA